MAVSAELQFKLSIQNFSNELNKVVRQMTTFNKEIKKANTSLRGMGKAASKGQAEARAKIQKTTAAIRLKTLAIKGLRKAAKAGGAALAVYAGTLGVARLLKFAEAAQTTTNRLRVAQRPGENLAKSFTKISNIARKTRQPLVELATMYQRITLATKGMNVTQAQAFKITENFGKLLTIQGASAHEARSALTQFTQALQSGKLAGDEFRSISENLPPVLDALVDATKRPRDQLKQLAEEGKLSTDLLLKAMLMATEKINKDFMKTSMTVAQAGNLINTELTILVKAFMDSENGAKGLVHVFNAIVVVIKFVAHTIGLVLQGVNALVNGFNALIGLGKSVGNFFSSVFGSDTEDEELMKKRTEALRAFGVVAQDVNDIAAGGPNVLGALGVKPTDDGTGDLKGGEATGENIRTLTAGFIKRNMKNLTMTFESFKQNFQDSVMQTFAHDFPQQVGGAFADMVVEGKSMTKAMGALFRDMAKQVIAAIVKMIIQMLLMKAIMMALGVDSFGNLTSGKDATPGKGIKDMFKAGFKGFFKARGGPVTAGEPYIVGEEGPELFSPSQSGTITPNDELGGPMGGGIVIQNLSIMPNSSIDQALMDKPASYWLEMAQEKILPALNTLGQGGETTTMGFREPR